MSRARLWFRRALCLVGALSALACGKRDAPAPGGVASAAPALSAGAATSVSSADAPAAPASDASATASAAGAASAGTPPPPPLASAVAPSALASSPPRPSGAHAGFRGPVDAGKDGTWLTRLAAAPITEVVRNRGGKSISLRVRFADGQRGVLKPEQRGSASNHWGEIAAYHVDRIVGFGRTAAVVGRSVDRAALREHLAAREDDAGWLARFDAEVVAHGGRVAGAMIAWHAGRLESAEPPKDWTAGLREKGPVPEAHAARLPEWSDLVVFDFLIDNTDRWSGGNVLSLGKGGPVIFLDNAASFAPWRAARGETTAERLAPVCRFRRATGEALRALGPTAAAERRLGAELRRSLAKDPLAPVLGEKHFSAIDQRVEKLLAHVERCVTELGDELALGL